MHVGINAMCQRSIFGKLFRCVSLIQGESKCGICRSRISYLSRQFCTAVQQMGVVYESVSNDIFTNLAFEDWVYNNLDLSQTNLLLLWRNDPCVVIGRHQNPWAECQLRQLWGSKVKLARRRSGGGTVYHDLGNLNCTFFTNRKHYLRKGNLELITNALKSRWPGLNVTVSCRDDILLDNFYKVSGSSSKLGRQIAYHHCTLLHSVNTSELKLLLHSEKEGMTNRATKSVQSAVKNLSNIDATIRYSTLVKVIAEKFYSQYHPLHEKKVYPVDPSSELDWPGVLSSREELTSWDWLYGKTPQFSVKRSHDEVSVLVHVNHAHISGVILQAPHGWLDTRLIQELTERLAGQKFWPADVAQITGTFLTSISADPNTRQRLHLVCNLLQETMS
ncbi:lipoyltransferase 1, mitochondrial-like [Acanthaster planci]|uniref:Lipoyltransferase 1, mitochondrial-like n=1 Tax=Acanthaster planci TaxID=133434 RepID=A0A8B7XTJ9_ACAPL|nr:lipoyltransferase 1, mitochondrial-like [Acanthaster planci]